MYTQIILQKILCIVYKIALRGEGVMTNFLHVSKIFGILLAPKQRKRLDYCVKSHIQSQNIFNPKLYFKKSKTSKNL